MEERRLDVLLWLEVGAMYVGRGATLQQTKHVIQKHHFLIAGKKEKCTTVEQVRASTTVMYKCLHVPELYVRRRDWFCAPQGRGCQAAPEEKTSMCQFNTPAARSGKKMNAWTRKPLTVWTLLWSHFICTAHTDGELLFSRDLCMSHMCTHESRKLFKVQTVRQKRQTDTKKRHRR